MPDDYGFQYTVDTMDVGKLPQEIRDDLVLNEGRGVRAAVAELVAEKVRSEGGFLVTGPEVTMHRMQDPVGIRIRVRWRAHGWSWDQKLVELRSLNVRALGGAP
jgi:hypothetical protein